MGFDWECGDPGADAEDPSQAESSRWTCWMQCEPPCRTERCRSAPLSTPLPVLDCLDDGRGRSSSGQASPKCASPKWRGLARELGEDREGEGEEREARRAVEMPHSSQMTAAVKRLGPPQRRRLDTMTRDGEMEDAAIVLSRAR